MKHTEIYKISLVFSLFIASVFISLKQYRYLVLLIVLMFSVRFKVLFEKNLIKRTLKNIKKLFQIDFKASLFFLMEFFIFYFVSIVSYYFLAAEQSLDGQLVSIIEIIFIFAILFGISFSMINLVIQKESILKWYTAIILNSYIMIFTSFVLEEFEKEYVLNLFLKLNSTIAMIFFWPVLMIPIFIYWNHKQ